MKGFSIVIPTYKENLNFLKLIKSIFYQLRYEKKFEVIIVDDNSADGIDESYKKIKNRYKNLKLFIRKKRIRDLTQSCIQGFKLSKFDNVLVMDSDLQHDPKYIKKMIAKFDKNNCDILVACRNFKDRSKVDLGFLRFFLSRFIILLYNFLLGFKTTDPMSGFFLFKKKIFVYNQKKLFGKGYKILVDLIYSSSQNLNIQDLLINFRKRKFNKSKMNLNILFLILYFLIVRFLEKSFKK